MFSRENLTYREFLTELHAQHGLLSKEIVLEAARPVDSPIHGYVFNKDIMHAAESYYLDRAGQLIRRYKVTFRPTPKSKPIRTRAFHGLLSQATRRTEYHPAKDIAEDPARSEILKQQLEREWKTLRRKAQDWDLYEDFVRLVKDDLDD